MKMVNSLYNSKLRYGVPLYGQIRWTEDETSSKIFSDIQLNQNRMMRSLNHSKISDKIRTKTIFEKYNMLSVNQINAQVKLNDMWKANNVANYPTKVQTKTRLGDAPTTRSISRGDVVEGANFSNLSRSTFINDATKAWNRAPDSIKNCTTYYTAKKSIRQFVTTLPF